MNKLTIIVLLGLVGTGCSLPKRNSETTTIYLTECFQTMSESGMSTRCVSVPNEVKTRKRKNVD